MSQPVLIAPSILAADFARLGADVADMMSAGADWVHIDVMDGHFVPNISFGPLVPAALRPAIPRFFDVHLMIAPVEPYLETFARAGADGMTIHLEATTDPSAALAEIARLGKQRGLAIKPGTTIEAVRPLLDQLDLLLVMTVEPGFGGQSYMPAMTGKIAAARALIGDRPIRLEVDGGITAQTAALARAAGADVLVAGTSLFKAADRRAAIDALRGP